MTTSFPFLWNKVLLQAVHEFWSTFVDSMTSEDKKVVQFLIALNYSICIFKFSVSVSMSFALPLNLNDFMKIQLSMKWFLNNQ